jgi:hypothetical protein
MTSNVQTIRQRPDPEVPLWVLIDKALTRGYVLSPLAAPHHRRDGLVFRWPSAQGKQVRPSPDGGRGHHRLIYEQVTSVGRPATRSSRHENASLRVRPGPGLRSGDPGQGPSWENADG